MHRKSVKTCTEDRYNRHAVDIIAYKKHNGSTYILAKDITNGKRMKVRGVTMMNPSAFFIRDCPNPSKENENCARSKSKLSEFAWSTNENGTCVPDTPGGPNFRGTWLWPAEELALNKALSYGLFDCGDYKTPTGTPYSSWIDMLGNEGSVRIPITWKTDWSELTSIVYTLEVKGWLEQHFVEQGKQWLSCSEVLSDKFLLNDVIENLKNKGVLCGDVDSSTGTDMTNDGTLWNEYGEESSVRD